MSPAPAPARERWVALGRWPSRSITVRRSSCKAEGAANHPTDFIGDQADLFEDVVEGVWDDASQVHIVGDPLHEPRVELDIANAKAVSRHRPPS